jgi:hypothetical protein
VAEGVESPSQAAALGRLGCQLGQGFLYGPPTPLPALPAPAPPAGAPPAVDSAHPAAESARPAADSARPAPADHDVDGAVSGEPLR